jgi:hypothetical protein
MVDLDGAPTLAEMKAWLGLDAADTVDDVVLAESLDAALAAQSRVCFYPAGDYGGCGFTDDLREAVFLRTQRLAARRNSPEGVVGLSGVGGDFVSARVPSYDADVAHLEGPWRTIPVA